MLKSLLPGPLVVTVLRLTRGFLFVPTLLAVVGIALAFGAVALDRSGVTDPIFDLLPLLDISDAGARTVLSTIAGAMMTVISLVYSLTLVVFTLAASNIGPRLLESFTGNRINQTTIGLLAATFLYALLVLYIVGDGEVPRFSVAFGILLAAISLFWLIYFVNDVAKSVKVDNEIARTQTALRRSIERLLSEVPGSEEEEDDDGTAQDAIPEGTGRQVPAPVPGYVTGIDRPALAALAGERDGFVELLVRPGDFVIGGTAIARAHGGVTDAEDAEITNAILIADARAPEGDLQFNLLLAVEIALRALSPGINDSYTAVSVIDHLSASLGLVLQRGAPAALERDDEGTPRVWVRSLPAREIVGMALHPLRGAAQGNVLVILRLIEAIGRMRAVSRRRHAPVLHRHLRLIAEDAARDVRNRDDRATIAETLARARAGLRPV